MNCKDIRERIELCLQNREPVEADAEVHAHVQNCELCYQRYTDARVDEQLRGLDAPDPDPDFASRVISRASLNRAGRHSFAVSPVAVAALLVVGIAIGLMLNPAPNTLPDEPAAAGLVYLQPQVTRQVRLAINSERARENVTMRLVVGDGLQVEQFPERQEISWTTSLIEGANVLTLPLRLDAPQDTYFHVSYTDGVYENSLHVDVRAADAGEANQNTL